MDPQKMAPSDVDTSLYVGTYPRQNIGCSVEAKTSFSLVKTQQGLFGTSAVTSDVMEPCCNGRMNLEMIDCSKTYQHYLR